MIDKAPPAAGVDASTALFGVITAGATEGSSFFAGTSSAASIPVCFEVASLDAVGESPYFRFKSTDNDKDSPKEEKSSLGSTGAFGLRREPND